MNHLQLGCTLSSEMTSEIVTANKLLESRIAGVKDEAAIIFIDDINDAAGSWPLSSSFLRASSGSS